MDKISKIDFKKYIVIKSNDLRILSKEEIDIFEKILLKIESSRLINGKSINKYLVLNTNDNFNAQYLFDKMKNFKKLGRSDYYNSVLVSKLAIHLVNSILLESEDLFEGEN